MCIDWITMSNPGVKAELQRCTTTFKVTVFRSWRTKQVLFLEAGKDFVDTLLSFVALPMGTIINVLSQEIQVNSLGGISCIFESLDSSFMCLDKNHLVQSRPAVVGCTCQPKTSVQFQHDLVTAEIMQPSGYTSPSLIYKCNHVNCVLYLSLQGTGCGAHVGQNYTYSAGPFLEQRHNSTVKINGFVKEYIKFIVTDKLEIIPSSIDRSLSLLKKLGITSLDDPESDEVTVSITQIVELLHSALISKKCLNDVFGKKSEGSDFYGTRR